ncbi:sulfatase-like hydrolase/transferase [Archangium violaceum]|uniref:sulfatase-like hydrolase/transferase n=1 Tax=Archangium violaceum TaxID=83451 RepID=UPI00193B5904|nr:sulfatase-like hydrolase/transferase [Archangium violaceum]QRK13233.1 sulfatase-like hydrolase/transferase [Archangium violaceum]
MNVRSLLFLPLLTLCTCASARASEETEPPQTETPAPARARRTILFQFDGLHYQAPEKLQLENVLALAAEGTRVEEAVVIIPWHPTTGEYGRHHLTSLPNPVTMSGTVLLTESPKMIQQSFGGRFTAHIANSRAYRSLDAGFTYSKLDPNLRDEHVLEEARRVLTEEDPVFMRIVLQDTNDRGGAPVALARPGTPWKNNLYAEGSPFIKEAREADALLGEFIEFLKSKNMWEDTLFILQADGASVYGWHPIQFEDSERIPLIFHGPGIARGKVIPYAENIDVTATIADFMGVAHPNPDGGSGRVLHELAPDVQAPEVPKYIKRFNAGVREYHRLLAHLVQESPNHPRFDVALMQLYNSYNGKKFFYGVDRILEWKQTGSLENLVNNNEATLACIRGLIAEEETPAGQQPSPPTPEGCW